MKVNKHTNLGPGFYCGKGTWVCDFQRVNFVFPVWPKYSKYFKKCTCSLLSICVFALMKVMLSERKTFKSVNAVCGKNYNASHLLMKSTKMLEF